MATFPGAWHVTQPKFHSHGKYGYGLFGSGLIISSSVKNPY